MIQPLRPTSLSTPRRLALGASLAIALLAGSRGVAQEHVPAPTAGDYVPPALQQAQETARVDERIGQQIPGDITFVNSNGKLVRLGDHFVGERPIILQMAYYRCPMLCGVISQGMVRSMRELNESLKIGRDFTVLTISFDSSETAELAASNKEAAIEVLGRTAGSEAVERGWHYMVGDDLNIKRLVDSLGYSFGWVDEAKQYSHPAAIVLVSPDGKISRYLYGVGYDPGTLRLSLIEASEGKVRPTSIGDRIMMACFSFDPTKGKYTASAMVLMRLAGVTTVLTIASIVGFLLVLERRRSRADDNAPGAFGPAR